MRYLYGCIGALAFVGLVYKVVADGTGVAPKLLLLALGGVVALTRPAVFLAVGGFLLMAASFFVVGIPGNELGAALIVIGVILVGRRGTVVPTGLVALMAALSFWFVILVIIFADDQSAFRRAAHITLWVALAILAAADRIPRRPLFLGVLGGAVVTLLLTLMARGINQTAYGGRATGLVGDPNIMAVTLAILTPLLLAEFSSKRQRASILILTGFIVIASLSRTGILALAIGIAVYYLLPRIGAWTLAFVGGGVGLLLLLPSEVRTTGAFAERTGSDILRARIGAAGLNSVAESPWVGHGLGNNAIYLSGGQRFLFHNSFLSLASEIGIIGGVAVGVLIVASLVRGVRHPAVAAPMAALSAALVGASALGEALLDLPIALAIGWVWCSSYLPAASAPEEPTQAEEPLRESARRTGSMT